MTASNFTVIDEGRAVSVPAETAGGAVRLSAAAVETALGWKLTPEGLCREAMCVPVRRGASPAGGESIDLAELAAALGRPLALDVPERAACLGVSAADRGQTLASLQAPDFALPDLEGRVHRLSDHRGRKVLLVAYASW